MYIIISLVLTIFNSLVIKEYRSQLITWFYLDSGLQVDVQELIGITLIVSFIPILRWLYTWGLICLARELPK